MYMYMYILIINIYVCLHIFVIAYVYVSGYCAGLLLLLLPAPEKACASGVVLDLERGHMPQRYGTSARSGISSSSIVVRVLPV